MTTMPFSNGIQNFLTDRQTLISETTADLTNGMNPQKKSEKFMKSNYPIIVLDPEETQKNIP